nr:MULTISPECIES: thiamine pyrophosphate-dependent enzyme [unclassified Mycobacterium]
MSEETRHMARNPEMSAANVGEQLELYRRMWVLRLLDMALEESRIDGLLNGPMVAAFGQEAVAVGTIAALRPGDIMSTSIRHFEHAQRVGHLLPLGPAIAEMITPRPAVAVGRKESPFATEWKQIFAGADPLRQSILFALGDAYAQQVAGEGKVTLCVIGDDAVNSAEFKSAAAIALSWRLPVVFVVENIREASGVRRGPRERHGLPVLSVDGKNVGAVYDSVSQAADRASAGGGPSMVEAVTYRTNHPSGVDPLVFARRELTRAGVSAGHLYEVERRARHLVAEAAAFANALRVEGAAAVSEPDHWSAAS